MVSDIAKANCVIKQWLKEQNLLFSIFRNRMICNLTYHYFDVVTDLTTLMLNIQQIIIIILVS